MILRTATYSLFAITLFATSCATMPKNTEAVSKQIVCGPGPEDMQLDSSAGKPRLIISCNQRRTSTKKIKYEPFGEIMEYGFDGTPAVAMARVGGPVGSMFNPHGISIAMVNGKQLLYVVNHSHPTPKVKENHIEVYEIQGSTLQHIKTISGPELISPNDCFANREGRIYFTNDSGKGNYLWEKLWKLKKSTVYCIMPDGTIKLVLDKLAYANGVYESLYKAAVSEIDSTGKTTPKDSVDVRYLFVSTVQQKALFYSTMGAEPNGNTLGNSLPVYGQDNIMLCGNTLVVACHPKPFKFLAHAMNPAKHSPTHVYTVDIKTGSEEIKRIFVDDGSRVSTGSTAILYKGKLYVSQVFQPYILEVDMSTVIHVLPDVY